MLVFILSLLFRKGYDAVYIAQKSRSYTFFYQFFFLHAHSGQRIYSFLLKGDIWCWLVCEGCEHKVYEYGRHSY